MARYMSVRRSGWTGVVALGALALPLLAQAPTAAAQAWEPTKPIQFIIPAGTGGEIGTISHEELKRQVLARRTHVGA